MLFFRVSMLKAILLSVIRDPHLHGSRYWNTFQRTIKWWFYFLDAKFHILQFMGSPRMNVLNRGGAPCRKQNNLTSNQQ